MSKLTPAEVLKKKYIVFASFYKLCIPKNNRSFICRNIADIYSKDYLKSRRVHSEVDALIVMMNPGSCKPTDSSYEIPEFEIDRLSELLVNNRLIQATPDNAQYQIMRLMERKGWNYVRILNLSDIKESTGDEFKRLISELESNSIYRIHSIFSEHRKVDRSAVFNIKEGIPVILAWGTDRVLKNLAKQCINVIPSSQIIGLIADRNLNLFYYASPLLQEKKEWWLNEIEKVLKNYSNERLA